MNTSVNSDNMRSRLCDNGGPTCELWHCLYERRVLGGSAWTKVTEARKPCDKEPKNCDERSRDMVLPAGFTGS